MKKSLIRFEPDSLPILSSSLKELMRSRDQPLPTHLQKNAVGSLNHLPIEPTFGADPRVGRVRLGSTAAMTDGIPCSYIDPHYYPMLSHVVPWRFKKFRYREHPPSLTLRPPMIRSGGNSTVRRRDLSRIDLSFFRRSLMALFVGTFHNRVDRKGRVSLPADFRSEVPDADHRMVWVFPSPRGPWLEAGDREFIEKLLASIQKMDVFSDLEEAASHIFLGRMRKLSWDDTGRVGLPDTFREAARIEGEALFIGMGSRFHVIAPEVQRELEKVREDRAKDIRFPLA